MYKFRNVFYVGRDFWSFAFRSYHDYDIGLENRKPYQSWTRPKRAQVEHLQEIFIVTKYHMFDPD